ncbi:hypothetical protein BCR36DRAFT_335152 [Piromyces finnis]|uniref:Calponin-homology (CH) domain-containing protein n=1 Tax=Piromyces finnis TaxID=1754191 RepID=A0A1Y1V112_9FUNG|nr:hypothetical protein BCR36DRAFT_335152 [Piromyces finnis]|eukprot:ORX44210.1 hypothetical protein BCR36DRAFT_335152 [Piromyces finnis]
MDKEELRVYRRHTNSETSESLKKNLSNDLLYRECLELSNIISREIKDIIYQVRNPKKYQVDITKPVSNISIKEENTSDKATDSINSLGTTQYKFYKKEQNISSFDINDAIKKFNNDSKQNITNYDTKLSTKKNGVYNSYASSPSLLSILPHSSSSESKINSNSIKNVPTLIDEIEAINESNTEYHYIDDTERDNKNDEEKENTDSDSGLPPKLPDDYTSSLSSASITSLTLSLSTGSSFSSKYNNHRKRRSKYSSGRSSLSPSSSPDASFIIKNGYDLSKESSENNSNSILSIIDEDESNIENNKKDKDEFSSISPIENENNSESNEIIINNVIKKLENSLYNKDDDHQDINEKNDNNDVTTNTEIEIDNTKEIANDLENDNNIINEKDTNEIEIDNHNIVEENDNEIKPNNHMIENNDNINEIEADNHMIENNDNINEIEIDNHNIAENDNDINEIEIDNHNIVENDNDINEIEMDNNKVKNGIENNNDIDEIEIDDNNNNNVNDRNSTNSNNKLENKKIENDSENKNDINITENNTDDTIGNSVTEIEQKLSEISLKNDSNNDENDENTLPEKYLINKVSDIVENNDNNNEKNIIIENEESQMESNDTMINVILNTNESIPKVSIEITKDIDNNDDDDDDEVEVDIDNTSIHSNSNSTNSSMNTMFNLDTEETSSINTEYPIYHKSASNTPMTPTIKAIASPTLIPKYTPGISNRNSNPNFSLHSRRPSSSLSMESNSPSFLPVYVATSKLHHKTTTSSDKTFNKHQISSTASNNSKKLNRLSLDSIPASPRLSKYNSMPSSPRTNPANKVVKHPPPAPSSYMSCRHTRYSSLNDNDLKLFKHKSSFEKNEMGSGNASPRIPRYHSFNNNHSKIPLSPQFLSKSHSRTFSNSSSSSMSSLPLPPSSLPFESSNPTKNSIIHNKRNSTSSIPIPSPKLSYTSSNASTPVFSSYIPSPKLVSTLPKTNHRLYSNMNYSTSDISKKPESHRRIKSYSFTNHTNNYKNNNNISYEDQFNTNSLMHYKDNYSKKNYHAAPSVSSFSSFSSQKSTDINEMFKKYERRKIREKEKQYLQWIKECLEDFGEDDIYIDVENDRLSNILSDGIILAYLIEYLSNRKVGDIYYHPKIRQDKYYNLKKVFYLIKDELFVPAKATEYDVECGDLSAILSLLGQLKDHYHRMDMKEPV